MKSMLSKAIAITAKAFENKVDKGGSPYILHCLFVMYNTNSENEDVLCAAVMHDLIEDTNWTYQDLLNEGFSVKVIDILNKVTHLEADDYSTYISKLSTNRDAILIKLADLTHNSDIRRMKGIGEKDFKRMEKYQTAYHFLKNKLKEFDNK